MAVVPIIIPFYRDHEKLRRCRAAIDAQTYPHCETFVRDNTHDNVLWTAAVNEGLTRYCYREDVQYVLVLNQDANMDPDCVRHLVAFMDAHPDCGIACPLQYQKLTAPVRKAVTWGGSLQAFPSGVHRTSPFESYKEPFETYWANGACMLIRARTVREVGLFDANMRFICSDADFSFTARSRGWKVCVVPQAQCEHALGASGQATQSPLDLVKRRDALYFTDKWLTGDLFKRLSLEGRGLAHTAVRNERRSMVLEIEALARQLGEHTPSAKDAYPSWRTAMHIPAPSAR